MSDTIAHCAFSRDAFQHNVHGHFGCFIRHHSSDFRFCFDAASRWIACTIFEPVRKLSCTATVVSTTDFTRSGSYRPHLLAKYKTVTQFPIPASNNLTHDTLRAQLWQHTTPSNRTDSARFEPNARPQLQNRASLSPASPSPVWLPIQ